MKKYFLLVIPVLILGLSLLLRLSTGPLWQYSDPCYQYLFNALHMLKGVAPTHIDHPGTPLQLLVLLIIRLFNLGRSVPDILHQVLTNPEFYLSLTNTLLLVFSFISSVLLSVYIYRKTKDMTAVLLSQLPALSFLIIPSFISDQTIIPIVANVSPEPMLFSVINLFNLSFLMLFFANFWREETLAALLSGFVCGLGLAVKLTFLPLLIIPLMVISWRIKPLFIITASLSFVLWTLPIINKYPLLWGWVTAIVTHTGYDGRGSLGLVDWHVFLSHLFKDIYIAYWFYFIPAAGIFIYTSTQLIKGPSDRKARFVWALTLGVLLQTVMVAKHFSTHYLVPGIGLSSAVFFLFYIDKMANNKPLKQLAIVFICLFIPFSVTKAMIYYSQLATTTKNVIGFHDKIYSKYRNCAIIPAVSNAISLYLGQEYALLTANWNSFNVESEELFNAYPKSFYINPANYNLIGNAKDRVFADDILNSCPCVVLLSGSDFSKTPYQTRLIETSKYANAYLLLGSTQKEANQLFLQALDSLKRGNIQQAWVFGLKAKQLNYQPEGQLDYVLTAIYQELLKTQGS